MPDEPRKIQLPQQVQAAMVASSHDVERTEREVATMTELAQTRHLLLLTQIERDYEFRFADSKVEKDGTVIAGIKRPRPIPPEALKNIAKQPPPEPPPPAAENHQPPDA